MVLYKRNDLDILMIDLSLVPVDITEHIEKFRHFLIDSWPHLDNLMENHDWDEDGDFIGNWLQLNWEMLIERELLEGQGFLTQFSVTHLSKRITFPNKIADYSIIAKSDKKLTDLRTKKNIPFEKKLRLYSFSTFKGGFYGLYPPFDLANLVSSSNELFITTFSKLKFELVKII